MVLFAFKMQSTVHNMLVDDKIFASLLHLSGLFNNMVWDIQKSNYRILFMHHLALKVQNHNCSRDFLIA